MDPFKTSDTHVAAFLVALEHPLRGIEGPRGRRVFVFDADAEADRSRSRAGCGS